MIDNTNKADWTTVVSFNHMCRVINHQLLTQDFRTFVSHDPNLCTEVFQKPLMYIDCQEHNYLYVPSTFISYKRKFIQCKTNVVSKQVTLSKVQTFAKLMIISPYNENKTNSSQNKHTLLNKHLRLPKKPVPPEKKNDKKGRERFLGMFFCKDDCSCKKRKDIWRQTITMVTSAW